MSMFKGTPLYSISCKQTITECHLSRRPYSSVSVEAKESMIIFWWTKKRMVITMCNIRDNFLAYKQTITPASMCLTRIRTLCNLNKIRCRCRVTYAMENCQQLLNKCSKIKTKMTQISFHCSNLARVLLKTISILFFDNRTTMIL